MLFVRNETNESISEGRGSEGLYSTHSIGYHVQWVDVSHPSFPHHGVSCRGRFFVVYALGPSRPTERRAQSSGGRVEQMRLEQNKQKAMVVSTSE